MLLGEIPILYLNFLLFHVIRFCTFLGFNWQQMNVLMVLAVVFRVILSATTGAAALWLSKSASIVHAVFRIPTHGYLFVLHEPSPVLTKLKNANVIIIDEMSMMTSNMLCAVEQLLRQSTLSTCTFSFQNKLVILVGHLAQLLGMIAWNVTCFWLVSPKSFFFHQ